MSGYCVTGNVANPITPKITIRMEITVDSTGRLIKLSNFMISVYCSLTTRFSIS